jgi:cytochrome c biogenesis protein CcmG, thiol:disulfide interchange protein DsbE
MLLFQRYGNLLLLGTLLAGSLFIVATRVQPRALTRPTTAAPVDRAPAARIDHPAPPFTLNSLDGSTVTLGDLAGQVVLINVWASWCVPCRAEMPMLQATYAEYHTQGFTILAVNQREPASTVAAYMQEVGLTFPALLDTRGTVSGAYRANVLPSSYLLDRRGVIRAVYRGPIPRSVLVSTVEQLLQEPA